MRTILERPVRPDDGESESRPTIAHTMQCSPTIVAVIQAADGARLVVAARRPEHITAALVDYVLLRAEYVLWPRAAARVRSLIETRDPDAAIATYFASVGSRWDEERLEIHVVANNPVAIARNCKWVVWIA